MALAPATVQRMPARLSRAPICLHPASTTFGEWRYFEQAVAEDAISALVNTDRARQLAKAARVILDECVIVGLRSHVHVETTHEAKNTSGRPSQSERIRLTVHSGEAAIPWADVLASGRAELG